MSSSHHSKELFNPSSLASEGYPEEAHIKDNKSLVSDFLSQHLNKGNKNDDNNRNV